MAGEYPSARTAEEAERRLEALLDSGITYFIDLTAEDDPLDPYEQEVRRLAAERGAEVTYSRRAIRDMRCPSPDEMSAILDEIDGAIADGQVVYVHCWGGIGRTGTVVGCFLVRRGHDGEAALGEVARLYSTMSEKKRRDFPDSPQTDSQRDFVRDWDE
jgi:protein tyrosine/serine phosphatase